MSTSLAKRHSVTWVKGEGSLVILQHGFGTDQTVWKYVVPSLQSGGFSILLLNLAGAGPEAAITYDPVRYCQIEAYADDLLLLLGELGIEECIYVGASVGAMVGLLASLERPLLFHKIIAIGASARYLNDKGYGGGFNRERLDEVYASMAANYYDWAAGFASYVIDSGHAKSPQDDLAIVEFTESLQSLCPDIALSAARAIFESDYRHILPAISVPTVFLQATRDPAVPMSAAQYLHEHVHGSVLEVLPLEGHFPQLSSPVILVESLLRHLA